MDKKKSSALQIRLKEALEFLLEEIQKPEGWYGKPYFSASCLERVVREYAQKKVTGYKNVRFTGLGKITLLEHCRNYLSRCVRNGELRADQPSGKHTCTGLRFRLATQELTESEKKTQATPREERHKHIRHFNCDYNPPFINVKKPLCQQNKTPRRFSCSRRPRQVWITNKPENVTCKNCLKMINKLGHPLAPELSMTTPLGIVTDYLEEKGDGETARSLRTAQQGDKYYMNQDPR